MATIVETIVGDRRLQLGAEEFVRQMNIGTNWGKIRIGFRWAMNGNATINGTTGPVIGVCQGTTNGFISTNTTDFIGMTAGAAGGSVTGSNATYTAGPPAYYNISNAGTLGIKRVANSNTYFTTGAAATLYFTATPATIRSMGFADITRTGTTYLTQLWGATAPGGAQADQDSTTFLNSMVLETPLVVSNVGAPSTVYSGSALFDSVSFSWNKASPTLELCDLVVVRFY